VDLLSNTLEFNQRAGVIFQAQSDSIAPSRIEANLVQQNGEGVLLAPTAHSIALIDNTIQGNRGGQFGGNGVTIQTESLEGAIRIERNQIFKNGGWAIRQEGADCVNATELNNTVRENECGGSGCAGGKEVEVRDCAGPVEKTEPLAPAPPAPTTQTSLPLPPAPQVETPVSSVPTGVETPANPAPITPPSMVMEFASSASTDLAVMAMTPAEPSIVVVNAANYQKQSVAPGSLVAIYYAGSVSGSCSATTLPLPTTLCGMQVRYRFFSPTTGNRDELLPLLYVDKSQINAQIPTNAAISVPGEFATITVQGVGESLDGSLSVRAIAPGLFPGSGGKAKVTRANGEEITERNPVIPGEQLTLWGTGFGATVRDSAGNKKVIVRTNEVGGDEFAIPDVSVRIGGVVAEGVRAFKAPKMVGVDQIVFSAPLTLQQGANQILVCRADSFAGGTVVCTDTDATVTIGPKKPALVRIAPYSSSSFPLRGERALAVGGLATAHHTGLEINTPCLGQAAPVRGESSPRTGANNVAPIVLCGVDLRISSAGTNQAVPLVYVDQNRIDFQIPFEAKSRADFELWFKGVRVGSLTALPVGSGDLSGYPLLLGAVGTEREAAPGQAVPVLGRAPHQSQRTELATLPSGLLISRLGWFCLVMARESGALISQAPLFRGSRLGRSGSMRLR
jgi:uncharacterized protein (TIGR03437 family)